jgi:DNA polymerase-3 subunit alpha
MEIGTVVSIEKEDIDLTCDIENLEKDFLIDEPNFICEGFVVHNSGVVISDVNLEDKIPIIQNNDGEYFCGFQESGSCTDLLQAGFIKFDILGVNNLDIIRDTIKEINKEDFNYIEIPEDLPEVFDVLEKECLGIFQMNTSLFKKLINLIKPKTQLELSDIIAIGRPGTLKVEADKNYVKYKQRKPDNIPGFIEDVLESSHYVLLYQEQVMKIFINLGFSEREADEVRGLLKKIQKLKLGNISSEEKVRLKELKLIS